MRDVPKSGIHFLGSELAGALSAAIITFPQAIGYGLIAFAVIGTGFHDDAVLLGLYSAILAGFVAAIFGGTEIQITGPKAPTTLLVASVAAGLAAGSNLPQDPEARAAAFVLLTALCVFIAGGFQLLLGAIRVGGIIKFVPHSVISGFMNGVAFLLIFSQLKPALGLGPHTYLLDVLSEPGLVQPLSLIVALVTLAVTYGSRRLTRVIPGSLFGLLVGTALYYMLLHATSAPAQILGSFEFRWPHVVDFVQLPVLVQSAGFSRMISTLVVSGLILGVIASMESLLSSVAADNLTGKRHSSNRELVGQGLGNIVCGLFGALPAAGSIPRSVANYKAGGRTRLSGALSALLLLSFIVLLSPVIGKIPLAVIAAIIISVGIDLFDSWTTTLIKKLKTHALQRNDVLFELLVAACVAVLTVTVNLVVAVVVGMVIVSALTIWQLGKSIVRREYTSEHLHSRKLRSEDAYTALTAHGQKIRVVELQGPLFFGSADRLASRIELAMLESSFCILDMRRVTDIDSTGARILLRTQQELQEVGKHLIICHLPEDQSAWRFLDLMDVIQAVDKQKIFADVDAALEWAEDRLLMELMEGPRGSDIQDIAQIPLFYSLSKTELALIHDNLQVERYPAGTLVFSQGDEDSDVFVVMRGSITITKELEGGNSVKRLVTFGPGSLLGELGFIDQNRRSATAHADEESELLRFSLEAFKNLTKEKPEIAAKILTNIGREISHRLRRTSEALAVLEDS